jgi:glucokinase
MAARQQQANRGPTARRAPGPTQSLNTISIPCTMRHWNLAFLTFGVIATTVGLAHGSASVTKPALLIGDIGGTNARFAMADPARPGFALEMTLNCADYETPELAIADYLKRIGGTQPEVICLAVAGPIVDQSVRFTNNDWAIDCADLQQGFPGTRARLLNDFEAIAYAIPILGSDELATIGLGSDGLEGKSEFNIGVVGPGTGLGVGGLLGREGRIYPVVCEGGHVGFAPENQLQFQVLSELRGRFERVSNERLLCGPGIENVYWAIRRIHGGKGKAPPAPEIFRRALANEDVFASETLQLFYEVLGQVAGNVALMLGAWDGIYIGGGIVKRYPDLLQTGSFRSGFENKGRYRTMMEKVPTFLVLHEQPGLLGAGHVARQMLRA